MSTIITIAETPLGAMIIAELGIVRDRMVALPIEQACSPMTAQPSMYSQTLPGPMDKLATFSSQTPYTFRHKSTTLSWFTTQVPS